MILNSPYITGSITVTGNANVQGTLTVTGSLSGTATSASLALNSNLLQGTGSVGFSTTASLLAVSSSQQQISSSLLQVSASYTALSGSYNTFSGSASTRITVDSASLLQLSASYISLSGSYNTFSGSASTRVTQIENVYATTGSNSFRANQSITGSLVVSSTITAQTLVVQTVTSSIVYSSGSNLFGSALGDKQTFTGSLNVTGSQTVFGNVGIGAAAAEKLAVTGPLGLQGFIRWSDGVTTSAFLGITGSTAFVHGNNFYLGLGANGSNNYSPTMMINNGKVGIGTTTPTSGSLQIFNSNGTNHIALNGGSYPNTYLGSFSGGTYFANNYFYAAGHASDNATKRSMEFYMSEDEIDINTMPAGSPGTRTRVMTISGSQGYIGIGTTSPSEKLHIAANTTPYIRIDDTSVGSEGGIIFKPTGYNTKGSLTLNYATAELKLATGEAGNGYFQTFYTNGVERIRITSAGKVGVGNTSPAAKLDVAGSFITNTPQYGEAKSFVFQSAFDNPTINLLTINNGNAYGLTIIRVTTYQNAVGPAFCNIHVGYAYFQGTGGSTGIIAPTIQAAFGGSYVGTLSWSGATLRYTANRMSNYDGYTVVVELGANVDNGAAVTYGGNLQ